jgi:hypothetical protein
MDNVDVVEELQPVGEDANAAAGVTDAGPVRAGNRRIALHHTSCETSRPMMFWAKKACSGSRDRGPDSR